MNAHFKKPLRITLISFGVSLVLVVILGTVVYNQKISERKMKARVEMLGQGLGMLNALIVGPFWIFAAGRVREDRVAAQQAKQNEETE